MKNGKKFLLLALAIILIASMLVASAPRGKSVHVDRGDFVTVNVGNAGINIADSFYTGTVTVKRTSKGAMPNYLTPSGKKFAADLLDVSFYDQDWNKIKIVTGAVYVYFTLKGPELKAYSNGLLHIYYYDTWKASWKLCPTYLTGGVRAACRISYFGRYALLSGK